MRSKTDSHHAARARHGSVALVALALSACSGSATPGDLDGSTDGGSATDGTFADRADAPGDAVVSIDTGANDASRPVDAGAPDTSRPVDASAPDASRPADANPLDASQPADADASDVSQPADAGAPDAPTTGFCPDTLPRVNVRDFGALGDGTHDDTPAFAMAAGMIQAMHGGELTIPPGVYRVGGQTPRTGTTGHYWTADEILTFSGLTCLHISGYGATLRLREGLRYGAFDAAGNPVAGPLSPSDDGAIDVGRMIEVSTSSNVLVEGLEVDGSNASLFLGGRVGDLERQGQATGLWFNRCTDVHVRDVYTHHHGLDGIAVLYKNARVPSRMPHLLERVVSEYNGRQGISWIGGWGLDVVDSRFNHTGRVTNHGGGMFDNTLVSSRPRAGLDIEPNAGSTERSLDGHFTRCEFVDNAGPGVDSPVTEGGDTTFTDCTMWGTTAPSAYILGPGIRFVDSTFHGTGVHANPGLSPDSATRDPALATRFDGCTFEDTPYMGQLYTDAAATAYTLTATEGQDVTWRNCTFRTHTGRTVYVAGTATQEVFDTCTFDIGASALPSGSQIAYFRGSKLTSCHFTEGSLTGTNRYYIDVGNVGSVTVAAPASGGNPTVVDGPQVHWGSTSGPTGAIAEGTY